MEQCDLCGGRFDRPGLYGCRSRHPAPTRAQRIAAAVQDRPPLGVVGGEYRRLTPAEAVAWMGRCETGGPGRLAMITEIIDRGAVGSVADVHSTPYHYGPDRDPAVAGLVLDAAALLRVPVFVKTHRHGTHAWQTWTFPNDMMWEALWDDRAAAAAEVVHRSRFGGG